MNYYKLNKKHKKWYIIHQVMLFASIIAMMILAGHLGGTTLIVREDMFRVPLGFIIIGITTMLAMLNRLKTLFKIKFIGFGIVFVTALFLQSVMHVLVLASGLMLIPLFIDDVILQPIWKSIWYNNYE